MVIMSPKPAILIKSFQTEAMVAGSNLRTFSPLSPLTLKKTPSTTVLQNFVRVRLTEIVRIAVP